VLNGRLRVAGIGELGEIHMRSRHMAAGYFGNDALTAERFFANPFTGASADRLYRTGDLGRYLPDGNVEFAGRADRQVKIRGHRIELGEIEAILLLLPGIRDAAVVVRESVRDKALVAYLVMVKGEPPPAIRELRGQLRRMLPDYMVPSAFVMLDSLPLTPNGKIDRDRLPEPKRPVAAVAASPASHTEQVLAGIWTDLMKLEQVGRHDNFFELGGHSLLAAQVMARVKRLLNCELPVRALFEAPTVSELSARIQAEQNGLAACELLQIELESDLAMRPDDETTEAAEGQAWKR
jgi:acyl carrier protein